MEIVSDTFPDPSNYPTCESIPLHEYNVTANITARFIRINLKTYYGQGSVFKYFNVIRSSIKPFTPPAVRQVAKSIVWQTLSYNDNFLAWNIIDSEECGNYPWGVWITPNGAPGSFVLDMNAEIFVKLYVIINTVAVDAYVIIYYATWFPIMHETKFNRHSTKDYMIQVSQDMKNWVTSVPQQALPWPGDTCDHPDLMRKV